jgi:hypothetical protein
MRLKSELWVKAYLRRCALEGAAAVLQRRGDTDAGAIYIKVSRLDGTASLFGPAPASLGARDSERRWQPCLAAAAAPEADLWIVVVEDRQGRHFLEDWLASP